MLNCSTRPSVSINEAWVNNVKQTSTTPSLPHTISANSGFVLNITYTVVAGANYQVKLVSSKGNQFYYSAVAPTS